MEAATNGTDTVQSLRATYTLPANVENLQLVFAGASEGFGNTLNNVLTGFSGNNCPEGDAGRDSIDGTFGDDTLCGGTAADSLLGGFGADFLCGDDGNDTADGGVGVDFVRGGTGPDSVRGGSSDDFVHGEDDADEVRDDDGNDRLFGGEGNDKRYGGVGADQIRGQGGIDPLHGEGGPDPFIFSAVTDSAPGVMDRVMDLVRGEDDIDLSAIDANTTLAGNQTFDFTGERPFFASPGDLWLRDTLLGDLLEGDVNGDGLADLRLLVTGVHDPGLNDILR